MNFRNQMNLLTKNSPKFNQKHIIYRRDYQHGTIFTKSQNKTQCIASPLILLKFLIKKLYFLEMSAADYRNYLKSKGRSDPRMVQVDMKQKYEIFQNMQKQRNNKKLFNLKFIYIYIYIYYLTKGEKIFCSDFYIYIV